MQAKMKNPPHPGEYIRNELIFRGWTKAELAIMIECPVSAITEILDGEREITAEMAKALGDVIGLKAETLLNLQKAYNLQSREREVDRGGG
jgi:addiction module HigA family antidote